MARRANPTAWMTIGVEAWMLGFEAAWVIGMRSWMIAMGGAKGERESRRMVEEKLAANMAFGMKMLTGQAGRTPETASRKALRHYGSRVRANRRRLSKK